MGILQRRVILLAGLLALTGLVMLAVGAYAASDAAGGVPGVDISGKQQAAGPGQPGYPDIQGKQQRTDYGGVGGKQERQWPYGSGWGGWMPDYSGSGYSFGYPYGYGYGYQGPGYGYQGPGYGYQGPGYGYASPYDYSYQQPRYSANTILVSDSQFQPRNMTVRPGTLVTWVNRGNRSHTITGDLRFGPYSDLKYPDGIRPDESYSWRVPDDIPDGARIYYHCRFHGRAGDGDHFGTGMTGVITVSGGSGGY